MKILLLSLVFFPALVIAQGEGFLMDKYYPIDSLGRINITSSTTKVYISGSDREDVHIKITRIPGARLALVNSDYSVDVIPEHGDLTIAEKYQGKSINMAHASNEEYKMEIYAPNFVSLYVKSNGGYYSLTDIHGDIEMNLNDADAELMNCEGKYFKFILNDTDLSMAQGKGRLSVSADDGDIKISRGQFESVNIKVEEGNLFMETSLINKGDYYYDIEDGHLALKFIKGGGNFDITHLNSPLKISKNFIPVVKEKTSTTLSLGHGNATVLVRANDATLSLISE